MPNAVFDEALSLDVEFDPLDVCDDVIDQENMDELNPYDTVDYPTMRNMPESMQREAVYTPERQGGAKEAVLSLLDHNPARRPVLLAIIDLCREGCVSSIISRTVNDLQQHNRSVYAPMTLCRMLERAGALELEMPEVSEAVEDAEAGVEYLEIKERIDPVWRATTEGLSVHAELTQGAAFHEVVLGHDGVYVDVYRAVMVAADEQPRTKAEIEDVVDAFDIVKNPRRFGGHFIDILERTDALQWKHDAWHLTDLGRTLLGQMPAEGVR